MNKEVWDKILKANTRQKKAKLDKRNSSKLKSFCKRSNNESVETSWRMGGNISSVYIQQHDSQNAHENSNNWMPSKTKLFEGR